MDRIIRPRRLFVILVLFFGSVLAVQGFSRSADSATVAGDAWLIKVADGESARELAESMGAVYVGPLRGVSGYHRIRFISELRSAPDGVDRNATVLRQLEAQPEIQAFEQEKLIFRYPRSFSPVDPRFPEQWHLENVGQSGGIPFADIRVRPVWDEGISGNGITIGIVDQGIQYTHPDLQANWLTGSGYDYNDNDSDPSPLDYRDAFGGIVEDRHGTAVAGISLAASNNLGGLGVAYRAKLVPLRLIAGGFETGEEAEALSYHVSSGYPVDIYNNSWGPSDDAGIRYVGISGVLKSAFADNTRTGRGGRGTVYVWAAGNGGLNGDNSNYDGYNASPYTISVAAVGDDDIKAGYSEPGANLLVGAPSRGRGAGILTTDNTGTSGYADTDYYDSFSGTSAAAPIVSGVVALMLEKRPELGWRDVQQILALTAVPVDFSDGGWSRNGAGRWVSHNYGFGRVDAAAAVSLAGEWPLLGTKQVAQASSSFSASIPQGGTLNRAVQISRNLRVQHALVRVSLNHSDWGDLRIELQSPSGTRSVLAEPHLDSNSSGQPGTWTYLSTHYLDESAPGQWTLSITDEGLGGTGSLSSWSLELWGTDRLAQDNNPPVAIDLQIESTTFPIDISLLQGASDPDGDAIKVLGLQQPRFSQLDDFGNGRVRFTMGATKNGEDVFSVLFSDGNGGVARRLVRILDPRPVARNDLFPVLSGRTTELPVLDNDLDPDGDVLRLVGLSGRYSGTASISGATITYTPAAGFTGVERIQYELSDDSDGNSTGWVTVIVQESANVVLDFDGEDDFVRLSNAPLLQTNDKFTAEAWIYPEDWGEYVTGFGRIFDRSTFVFFLNGFDHEFYNDKSLVAYFVLEDGTSVAANSASNAIQLNKWQHVAVSYDSSNSTTPVRLYVNGFPVSLSYPIEGSSPPDQPLADNRFEPLYIGEAPSRARAFKGYMGEFRIWNAVIAPLWISARHAIRMSGFEGGLQFYLPLNRTLAPEAVSAGSLSLTAQIYEAQRVPYEIPWRVLENNYTLVADAGNGWWQDRTLGWLFGDYYPWVKLGSLGWVYSGHGAGGNPYVIHVDARGLGWLATTRTWYPWFYQYNTGNWVWYLEGTDDPSWLYSFDRSEWMSLNASSAGQ